MIDHIGTEELNRRPITKRSLSKTIGLMTVVAMVGMIMALWGAFLLWASIKLVLWAFYALGG